MKAFLVRGTFRMGDRWTPFAKEVAAADAVAAVERVTSDLGSKHRAKRMFIKVRDVAEVPPDRVEDPIVRFRLGGPSS